ncbi:MAG TPA: thymidine phosphorylase [Ktedonobacterales bacterium]|nr:thymidine phosphorylase [Ktedonobacterales bacterium]
MPPPLNVVELIRRKRGGEALAAAELTDLIIAYTQGGVPDYQMAAWLMAVVWRGMTVDETTSLTLAMADSGERLSVRHQVSPVADKHSTGGVGDKLTLVVAPLVAACGLPVAKMSGRGLGHTGGTIDKLEAIPGLRTNLTRQQMLDILRAHGLVLAAQSATLAPADGKLYALRDVTATVESIPLIAASIMSKKLAVGPSHLLLDVKVGMGAFMKSVDDARELAHLMVKIGDSAGIRTVALLTAMEQPLGHAVGNALEVAEAIETLRGNGPADLTELALDETATLLAMANVVPDEDTGRQRAEQAIADGSAVAKLAEVIAAQGGDPAVVATPAMLPRATWREDVLSPKSGYLAAIDAEAIGRIAGRLGAGRQRKEDTIDPAVGLLLRAKVGDYVAAGNPLVAIHAPSSAAADGVRDNLLTAYRWSDQPPATHPLLLERIER